MHHTEQELEKATLKYFPYNGQDAIAQRREHLRQERIANERAVLDDMRREKSAEDDRAQFVSLPKFNDHVTEQPAKKILGKMDEGLTANAMQVALKRYEQDLEMRRQQREADLKNFKDKIQNDSLELQKEQAVKKAKQ